ncbi:MAG TPA: TolC family protein [Gemmatimonadaceae bacterium]|nr:TolC family protein [Gemmatimonadaceae bacterium]
MTRIIAAALLLAVSASRLTAQGARQVSLEDAIRLADRTSETVEIARAAVLRARGQQLVARSQFLPQLNVSASYARTLASQFEGFSLGGGPDTTTGPSFVSLCTPNIPATATPAERQAALDQARSCEQGGGGFDFSSVGFGAKNQWVLGLNFSQNIFTAGRATGLSTAASAGRTAAEIELTAQRAQLILDITQAYYNAVLATRLAEIADASLTMSDDVLRQTTAARQVGSSSEFDLLRAQVARDNQRPLVLQRRSDANIAMLRLKQLLELPLDDTLALTTDIDVEPATRIAGVSLEMPARPDTSVDGRASVRQASEAVRAQRGMLRAARADRYPTLALTSGYQRLFFPSSTFPDLGDFRENWTVGFSAGVNLLSGGRTRGNVLSAQADLRTAEARLKQTREFAALDARIALSQLEQAEATYRASRGTAEQARRAYSIDQIRYREGISTQTDLNQSQLLVEQAMVNQAVAARDLAVARMRLALLRDLPLGAAGGTAGATSGAGGASAAPSAPPQQRSTSGVAATSGSVQQ